MKKVLVILLILTLAVSFAACSSQEPCRHQWGDAPCTEKPVCTLCGAEAEIVKGHTWQEATMDAPKTCSVCKVTYGEPLSLKGTWKGVAQFFPIYFGVETEENHIIEAKMTLALDEDGKMELTLEYDKENYDSSMAEIFIEMIYSGGTSQEEVDAQYMTQYGMTVAEYAAQKVLESAPENYKEQYTFAYTLEGDKLLYGENADNLDRNYSFTLDGEDLVLRDEITDMVYDLTKAS